MRPVLPPLGQAERERLVARGKAARDRRDRFARLLREAMALAMPERDGLTRRSEGQDLHAQVYDGTAVVGVSRFANRFVQAMFPPQQRWAALERGPALRDLDEAGAKEVDTQFEAATRTVFDEVAASNFDLAIVEAAHDLAFGTMVLLVDRGQASGWGRPLLQFQALPAGTVALEDGPFGAVEGVWYPMELPARDVQRRWPDATLTKPVAEAARAPEDKTVRVVFCTTFEPQDSLWRLTVLDSEDQPLVERASRTSPFVVVRWLKAPGEVYGRGPMLQALPDVRTLNKAKELVLKSAALAVGGMWTARDDGVLNPYTIKIVPGAIVPVMSNGSGGLGPSLAPLPRAGDVDLSMFVIDEMQRDVKTVLFDHPLPPEVRSNVSATEIMERMALYAQDTGAFGRVHADGVVPLMLRIVDILDEAGKLPGLASHLADGALSVAATSPLARMQDNADVQAIDAYLRRGMALEGLQQGVVRQGVDLAATARWLAERTGVPAELRRTAEDAAREAKGQQDAAEAEMLASSPVAAAVADNLTAQPGARR